MARGRVISPDFWSDGNMVGVSAFARLLYIGMWNFSYCDKGHLDDDAMGLKLKILPADQVDPQILMAELATRARVVRIRAETGKTFLFMPTFESHQKADPRWKTRCPACALINSGELTNTPVSFVEHTETLQSSALREEKRREPERTEPERREVVPFGDDVSRLCELLAARIEANGSILPKITQGWLDAARLLIDKDKRDYKAAYRLINWCQQDTFWKANILSMPKFREQYDKVRLAANRELEQRQSKPTPTSKALDVIEMGRRMQAEADRKELNT